MSVTADGTFDGFGGVSIYWQRHDATGGPPRGVVVLSHGYAEHVGRYTEFITHCTSRQLAVVALDHRGHGRSGGPRGHCRDFDEMVADLRQLNDMATSWWPKTPRLLFGHSLGGLIGFLYLLAHPETVRAAALSAPALRVPAPAPPWVLKIAFMIGGLLPRLPLATKLDANALSRDPAVGPAYLADPLVHRAATAGGFRAITRAQQRAFEGAPHCFVPLMILQGDADQLVDPTAPTELAARLTCPHELVMLPGFYHELLNEPPAERRRVVERLDEWFDRWLAPPER